MARLAVAVAAVALAAAPDAGACARSGYSYGGYAHTGPTLGVAAQIAVARVPSVTSGHVGAWVGFGAGDEWIQAGVAAFPGGRMELYYEYIRPRDEDATYISLGRLSGTSAHLIAVLETAPNVWVAAVDGTVVSPRIALPASHNAWRPVATTESLDDDVPGACNGYRFDFRRISVRTSAGWQPFTPARTLRDPGHDLLPLNGYGFVSALQ